jgi:hypothetical protein
VEWLELEWEWEPVNPLLSNPIRAVQIDQAYENSYEQRYAMHYPFSVIALRRDQRTEGRETRRASTPTGPGRDAIAKSVMVYTAVPPDCCDNDVGFIVQQAPSGVNSLEKMLIGRGEKLTSTFKVLGYYHVMRD